MEKARSKEQILHEKADKVDGLNRLGGSSRCGMWGLETTNWEFWCSCVRGHMMVGLGCQGFCPVMLSQEIVLQHA